MKFYSNPRIFYHPTFFHPQNFRTKVGLLYNSPLTKLENFEKAPEVGRNLSLFTSTLSRIFYIVIPQGKFPSSATAYNAFARSEADCIIN